MAGRHASQRVPLRLGISRCLVGEPVRFDGDHMRNAFLTDVLGRYVEWIPVCPEVEAGLGTPREPMRLVEDPKGPRLVTIDSGTDHTRALTALADSRLRALEALDLAGFVFKSGSPSCGVTRVPVHDSSTGMPTGAGTGLFAQAYRKRFPLIPIEDEARLSDPDLRDHFIERVFACRRWQDLMQSNPTRQAVSRFHAQHQFWLLARHGRPYGALERLLTRTHQYRPKELAVRYGRLFMRAMAGKATARQHVTVLQHMLGCIKKGLSPREIAELVSAIEGYQQGRTPVIAPLRLLVDYAAASPHVAHSAP